ncbi:hypothetical protein BD626DRAFT_400153, partial [Schizophyllum amplum]
MQAVLSFFYKQYKRKKRVRGANAVPLTPEQEEEEQLEHAATPEEDELADAMAADAAEEAASVPAARLEDDAHQTNTVRDQAIREMCAKGVTFSASQEKQALGVMPKVSGLARRVHDSSSVLKPAFERIVASTPGLPSDRKALTRLVKTRWNSEYACLDDHLELRVAVEKLTSEFSMSLGAYRLTEPQWRLAGELCDVLGIFVPITEYFSRKETPLVMEVLERLEDVIGALKLARDTTNSFPPLSPVTRVAAHAGFLVGTKYMELLKQCEVYQIAIVLSPDRKLQWFKTRNYSAADIDAIRERVVARWEASY